MSLTHDANGFPPSSHSPAGTVVPPSGSSLSNLLGDTPPPSHPQSMYPSTTSTSAVLANIHTEESSGNPSGHKQADSTHDHIEGDDHPADSQHIRSASNSSGPQRRHMSPQSSPYYNGRGSQSFHQPLGQQRRSSATGHGGDLTPPAIRYTQSDAHPGAKRGSFSGSNNTNGPSQGSGNMPVHGGAGPDEGKNMYQLWLPWEETALVDWLYEPTNCKLFNEPRRKKECHERIIREILSSKTSRSIEGKIRTLEKRYLKASTEIQRPDFASVHPGKLPIDVAEALCNNFHKLETIFKSGLAQQQQQPSQVLQQQKKTWAAGSPASESGVTAQGHVAAGSPFDQRTGSPPNSSMPAAPGTTSLAGAGSMRGVARGSNADLLSIPRASPPRLTAAESLPYQPASHSRKIAPKRGPDGSLLPDSSGGTDADGPLMMSSSKRSRTFPAMLQTRHSPGHLLQPADPRATAVDMQQLQQQTMAPHRSPMAMQMQVSSAYSQHHHHHLSQQQQQQLYYQRMPDHPRHIQHHYPTDAAAVAGTAPNSARSFAAGSLQPLASTQSPMGNGIGGSATGPPVSMQPPLSSSTPSAANVAMPSIRETLDAPGTGQHSAAVLGTREELEWLQFNLRREELEFRKTVFVHEKDLESKRMRIEETRLDVQKREMEVEAKRIEMQTKQMDLHMDSLRSLTSMLGQMVGQMSTLVAAKSGSGSKSRRRDSADSLDK
ncbi:hypothetical protein GGI20_000383 [Coemansia sp. BCRC 34301]|nr:hypothetical protein GGI20_000383 [Coemansia sp. BCRC 34301]